MGNRNVYVTFCTMRELSNPIKFTYIRKRTFLLKNRYEFRNIGTSDFIVKMQKNFEMNFYGHEILRKNVKIRSLLKTNIDYHYNREFFSLVELYIFIVGKNVYANAANRIHFSTFLSFQQHPLPTMVELTFSTSF